MTDSNNARPKPEIKINEVC